MMARNRSAGLLMRWLLVLLVAICLGFGHQAAAQAPAPEEKPADKPDWASLLGFDRPAAQARYDDERTPEGWAWARIKQDKPADLNLRCDSTGKTRLDSHEDAGWDESCRKIPAAFVTDVLTVARWRDRIGRHGLRLRGARIDGDIDLANAEIRPDLLIEADRIEGSLDLTSGHLAGVLSLRGTQLRGGVAAERLHADDALFLNDRAAFKGGLTLNGAKVGGPVDMDGSAFDGTVSADGLAVEGNLLLGDGAIFTGTVLLNGARVGGNVEMDHSGFGGTVAAEGLSVARSLLLRGATFRGTLFLRGARVGLQVELDGSAFEGNLDAEAMTIGQWMSARDARFAAPVVMTASHIMGGLDLRGAVANRIDLTGAVIGEDLVLGDGRSQLHWQCAGLPAAPGNALPAASWPLGNQDWRTARCDTGVDHALPLMVLRDTKVGSLQDSADAWPPELDLEGFRYDHFGGGGMRARSADQWRDWLDRDRTYSSQPATQLASVLVAAGHRDTAGSILYAERERARREAFANGDRGGWIWMTCLWAVAGYGIGTYSFRVLWWLVALSVLGTVMLFFAPRARHRGLIWCFGASLQRLLPVIAFNKSFTEFFDNPPPASVGEQRNLNGFLAAFFSVLALAGWVLGLVLLAALTTATPAG